MRKCGWKFPPLPRIPHFSLLNWIPPPSLWPSVANQNCLNTDRSERSIRSYSIHHNPDPPIPPPPSSSSSLFNLQRNPYRKKENSKSILTVRDSATSSIRCLDKESRKNHASINPSILAVKIFSLFLSLSRNRPIFFQWIKIQRKIIFDPDLKNPDRKSWKIPNRKTQVQSN